MFALERFAPLHESVAAQCGIGSKLIGEPGANINPQGSGE
jgi:hypothetical protein